MKKIGVGALLNRLKEEKASNVSHTTVNTTGSGGGTGGGGSGGGVRGGAGAAGGGAVAVRVGIPEALKELGYSKHILNTVDHAKLLIQKDYLICPRWAGRPPQSEWKGVLHLEAVRRVPLGQGQQPSSQNNTSTNSNYQQIPVGRYMIDRHPYYLFGANRKVCDHHIEHPSFSRVHMAIVHHGSGTASFLVDLNSSNGVFLNGRRLQSREHAALDEDDEIRIGASSRIFIYRKVAPVSRSSGISASATASTQKVISSNSSTTSAGTVNANGTDGVVVDLGALLGRPQQPKTDIGISQITKDATDTNISNSTSGSNKRPRDDDTDNAVDTSSAAGTAVAGQNTTTTPSSLSSTAAAATGLEEEGGTQQQTAAAESENDGSSNNKINKLRKRRIHNILIKHKDTIDPISRAKRDKGTAITRDRAAALAIATAIREQNTTKTTTTNSDGGEIRTVASLDAFKKLAKQHSECKTSAKGGGIGVIKEGSMVDALDAAIFGSSGSLGEEVSSGLTTLLEVSSPVDTDLGVILLCFVEEVEDGDDDDEEGENEKQ